VSRPGKSLSRQRRFGKSPFLDTLTGFFAGNRALFCGLAALPANDSPWEVFGMGCRLI